MWKHTASLGSLPLHCHTSSSEYRLETVMLSTALPLFAIGKEPGSLWLSAQHKCYKYSKLRAVSQVRAAKSVEKVPVSC